LRFLGFIKKTKFERFEIFSFFSNKKLKI